MSPKTLDPTPHILRLVHWSDIPTALLDNVANRRRQPHELPQAQIRRDETDGVQVETIEPPSLTFGQVQE